MFGVDKHKFYSAAYMHKANIRVSPNYLTIYQQCLSDVRKMKPNLSNVCHFHGE